MIGYLGDIIFETSDKKILTFNNLHRTASANYADHARYKKKPQREYIGPNNEGVTFKIKITAGHGVKPWNMVHKLIVHCEKGHVLSFVLGGHKVASGKWTIDAVDSDYKEVWNRGELVAVECSITATEYH